MESNDYIIGVDMGGTKILAGVVNAEGKIVSQAKTATNATEGADKVINRIAQCIREVIDQGNLAESAQIRAIDWGTRAARSGSRGCYLRAESWVVKHDP